MLSLLLISLSVWAKPAIQVREFSTVKAGQTAVSFADIAELKDLQEADQRKLQSLTIGNAPHEDESREFTSFALSEILRAPLNEIESHYAEKVQLSIPRTVHVEVDSHKLNARKAKNEIERFYQASCAGCELVVSDIKIAAKEPVREWRFDFKPEMPRGPFTLPVRTPQNTTIWVSGKLTAYRTVPVALRALNAGEHVQPSDVAQQRRDVTFASDNIPGEAELVGATLARSVSANQVVWKNSLLKAKALSRGDVIKIMTGSDAWQVSVMGVAQQAGYIGEAVQVLNSSTQKMMMAVVVDKGVVRVQ